MFYMEIYDKFGIFLVSYYKWLQPFFFLIVTIHLYYIHWF